MDLYFNIWIFYLIIMACSFDIVTWNVKGLNHPVKRKRALTHLRNLSAGIAFVQETHLKSYTVISFHLWLISGVSPESPEKR